MKIDTRDLNVVQVVRDLVEYAHLTFLQVAERTGLTEKEIKQIYKKGVVPIFDKKMKILNTFKEQWIQLREQETYIVKEDRE